MKNKMSDVRDHLVAMMEELGDQEATSTTIERAKGMALLADKFIASAKCEIEARRVAYDIGASLPKVFGTSEAAALEHEQPAK
jgi:hypothetical protein